MLLKYRHAHPWTLSIAEAKAIQDELRHEVVIDDQLGNVDRIAGVDVGFDREQQLSRAGVAVLHFPSLELQEEITANDAIRFPYFPGLLSFREIPVILKALAQLTQIPDLLLCDGQGIAHPRRLGIASHLGVITGLPTIGVAKKRSPQSPRCMGRTCAPRRGDWCRAPHSRRDQTALCIPRPSYHAQDLGQLRHAMHNPLSPAGNHPPRTSARFPGLRSCFKNVRAPAEQGARRRDKIVRSDFEQLQAARRGEPRGWGS
jgi:hypothetical protein